MLKQTQQQYSFILPTWKNHEKPTNFIKKIGIRKGNVLHHWGDPNGGAAGGGPGIGCIGWKGLASAVHHFTHFWGKIFFFFYEVFLGFLKIIVVFFLNVPFEAASFPLCCVPHSFHWFFFTDFSNSLVQLWALGRQPIGRQGIALEIWETKVSSAHFTERTQAADVEGWLRTGAAHPQFHLGKAVLSIAGLRILSHAYLLRPQQGMVHMSWDLPSRPRRLMAWFAMFSRLVKSSSDLDAFWASKELCLAFWHSLGLWWIPMFTLMHHVLTWRSIRLSSLLNFWKSSPIKSSTKWPLTKMTSCSNIEVGAQLHTNLRRFIDQFAVRTFKISKETIKVKATFYTVINHTWHCDILYHHLRMISNACLYWLHLYLLRE